MRPPLGIDDRFFDDLETINGPALVEWRQSLFFRLRDSGHELPEYKYHGRWVTADSFTNLSSNLWHSSGLGRVKMTLWYVHNPKIRTMLFAEHARTVTGGESALKIVFERAEILGLSTDDFERSI